MKKEKKSQKQNPGEYNLLRLRETHCALQLLVLFFFLFFCQVCREYRGIRSKKLFYSVPVNSALPDILKVGQEEHKI